MTPAQSPWRSRLNAAQYELFDHTADIGVRVSAPTLAQLIPPAVDGLYAVIGELVLGSDATPYARELRGDEASLLVHDFLATLLVDFERRQQRLTNVHVTAFTATHLSVTGTMRPVDMERSLFDREVKAITYHELAIRTTADGCELTYIVDI